MELPSPDPRVSLIACVAACVVAPPVRRAIGRGIGYGVRGVMKVGAPVATAGRDVYASAREVASPHPQTKKATTATREAATV